MNLAFHARSKEQVDEITEKLQEKGINILYLDRHPYAGGEGHYAVYFEDPDRIKIELVAPSDHPAFVRRAGRRRCIGPSVGLPCGPRPEPSRSACPWAYHQDSERRTMV